VLTEIQAEHLPKALSVTVRPSSFHLASVCLHSMKTCIQWNVNYVSTHVEGQTKYNIYV
jgi:hypothetical protein